MTQTYDIATIGAGFSGTMLAAHLLRLAHSPLRLLLLDRRPEPARGISYSTLCEQHVLNVPAGKMSAFAERPDHFLSWLEARQPVNVEVAPGAFVPRMLYSEYHSHILREAQVDCGPHKIFEFVSDEAVALE